MLSLGAVLYQEQDTDKGKQKRVIAYASIGLNKAEKKLSSASKWAVTQSFYDYLYGNRFTVLIDNNHLTYVLASTKLDATDHRWLAALYSFDFNILYSLGNSNTDADGLSRLPGIIDEANVTNMKTESLKAICNLRFVQPIVQSCDVDPNGCGSICTSSLHC